MEQLCDDKGKKLLIVRERMMVTGKRGVAVESLRKFWTLRLLTTTPVSLAKFKIIKRLT